MGGHVGSPSDSGRIEEYLRAGHRRQPRRFGKPLIPAYQHTYIGRAGMVVDEIEVTRGEIKFLVITRIVRNMHFAIMAGYCAGTIQYQRGIVINARSPALENR